MSEILDDLEIIEVSLVGEPVNPQATFGWPDKEMNNDGD